jgi:ABC-type amino acid transport substrate-binding protein
LTIQRFIAALLVLILSLSVAWAQDAPTLDLTEEERAWLDEHPLLKVANEVDWPPFDYAVDGEPAGYSIDMARLLADRLGVEVEFVTGPTWAELLELFKAGKIDLMPAIYETEERREFAEFTSMYFRHPTVLVVRDDEKEIAKVADLAGKRIAVIPGFAITSKLREAHPEFEFIEVQGVSEAVVAVSVGSADASSTASAASPTRSTRTSSRTSRSSVPVRSMTWRIRVCEWRSRRTASSCETPSRKRFGH